MSFYRLNANTTKILWVRSTQKITVKTEQDKLRVYLFLNTAPTNFGQLGAMKQDNKLKK